MAGPLYIGLMSGTSIDAIDVALLRFDPGQPKLLATHEHPLPAKLKDEIARISLLGENEIERLGVLDRELGRAFAEASLALLESEQLPPTEIRAIGSHGQTIRHRPPSGGHAPEQAFTLQIGDPNTIAELSGIDTVADFRRRDVAAGGEGAPLAPAFHRAVFSQAGINRAVVNIGGIANFNLRRKHPIYGTVRAHRGTDYAAPTGTPVYAAGDGRVSQAGYSKSNGNYVFIQHGEQYVTKYLHLHKRRVKTGQRVSQSQVIGTVGATGAATGPHLHYEFLMNGVHRNPRTIHKKLPKAKSLAQSEMAQFQQSIKAVSGQLASLASGDDGAQGAGD